MNNKLGELNIVSVSEHTDLLSQPTAMTIKKLATQDFGVIEIDPQFSDTTAFCEHYKISPDQTINCVVIKAVRADKVWFAGCLILATMKADVNGLIRRHFNARKASFAPMEEVVALTKMEYSGITAIGLPSDWTIIIDKAVADSEQVVLGSGIRKSKIVTSGKALVSLPNAIVLENVGVVKNVT